MIIAQGSPDNDYHPGNRGTQLLSHSTTSCGAVAGSLCFMRLLFFDRRQDGRFLLSAIDSCCSSGNSAKRQLAAIIGKEYLSDFVGAIVPALEDGQLVAEALRGWVFTGHERLQRGADAAIKFLSRDRISVRL